MERPLSPFMFPVWYRFQITSALSILHRLTGIGLAVGSILLAWWLISVAAGGGMFEATRPLLPSSLGLGVPFLWSGALFFLLCHRLLPLGWVAGLRLPIPTPP